MVAPALMDQQQRRSSSALESKSVNRHSLPVQRTRTKSMHIPSFSNTHPLIMATPSPSSPPSSPILEAAKKRPRPPLVISMPPYQNNDLTRSTTASTASSAPSVLHRVKRSISRTIKSGRVADKPDASYESHVKHNPIPPSTISSPIPSSERSSITSLPPLSPPSPTSSRPSSMSIHHQHHQHPHYHYHARQSISLDPISEEQPGETKKSGKLKRWQSKSSAKLKKWLHIDNPSKPSSSELENNSTITPSARRDSNATTCSSCASHEDSHSSSIGSSPNTSIPPSPALSARSVLSSFSSRPTSLPSPVMQAITLPPPVPTRRSSLRTPSRSEGRPVSTPGRTTLRSSSLRVSMGSRSPPGRIPPRSSSLPRSYRSSFKRRSLLGRTLSTEIPPVPESPEEASFYAALAQVAAEVDEAIAAASEESESESTCSVRSRSSETLLLSEDEQAAREKQVGSPRSSLSPYVVSPETHVPIPWSCSDVLLGRPAALPLEEVPKDIEAMVEVQAMVTEQHGQYKQSTTIMSLDVHDNNRLVQDMDLPEETDCINNIALMASSDKVFEADIPTVFLENHKDSEEDAHSSTDTFEAALSLLSDDEEVLDHARVDPAMEAKQETLLKRQQDDVKEDVEDEWVSEVLDADNVEEEEVHVLTRDMSVKEPMPEASSEGPVIEVTEENQDKKSVTTPCETKSIHASIYEIAQPLFDEIAFSSEVFEKESTPDREVAETEPILVGAIEHGKDQEVETTFEEAFGEAAQEDPIEQAMAPELLPVESISHLVDDSSAKDVDETKEVEAIIENIEDLRVMGDPDEQETLWVVAEEEEAVMVEAVTEPTAEDPKAMNDPEEPETLCPAEGEKVTMAEVMPELTTKHVETLMEEPEPVSVQEVDEPLINGTIVATKEMKEINKAQLEEAIEMASVDELAIVVSYEDPCQAQTMAPPAVAPYHSTSPLPSPEFRPVQVEDELDIIPLVLPLVDVIPEPTAEGSVVIQEDTAVRVPGPSAAAAKGVVWEALQELHPPAVSPWKRASRSPWLSASFWLHGQ